MPAGDAMPSFSQRIARAILKPLPRTPRTPREVFDLAATTTPSTGELKTKYITLLKQYHPDRTLRLPSEERIRAREAYEEVRTAYVALMEEAKRREQNASRRHGGGDYDPPLFGENSMINGTAAWVFFVVLVATAVASRITGGEEQREIRAAWLAHMGAMSQRDQDLSYALGYQRKRPPREQ
ncbi:hypothetical protein HDU89_000272 [Geranomyces variabilis]|nr:hypothetical protein HDU89_000272 [Geranomyces variabilis]